MNKLVKVRLPDSVAADIHRSIESGDHVLLTDGSGRTVASAVHMQVMPVATDAVERKRATLARLRQLSEDGRSAADPADIRDLIDRDRDG